ncbi:MAG: glycosyltransferase [Planctomycetaceae bacterium]|nr:glycosyltransferase [Planctomycetaceae bacterium]
MIVISQFISEKYARKLSRVFLLPSIFDFRKSNKANSLASAESRSFSIVYAGSCKPNDGFGHVLDAVDSIVSRIPAIRLEVLGTDGIHGFARQYRDRCMKSTTLCKVVHFNGFLSEEEYSTKLYSASCLLVPRPDTEEVRAAFPTRIPEFLSTGNALITSAVPDANLYLQDRVDAYLYDANDSNSLANTLVEIFENAGARSEVGLAGKLKAQRCFCFVANTKKLLSYLNQ